MVIEVFLEERDHQKLLWFMMVLLNIVAAFIEVATVKREGGRSQGCRVKDKAAPSVREHCRELHWLE